MPKDSRLFQFQHGDHTCVFYRTDDSLSEILTPYIAEGLRRGERCFLAQKPHIRHRLISDLQYLGIDTDDAARRGALDIHTEDETYFPNRHFVPAAMLDMLLCSIDDAAVKGFSGFRTAGEMSWAVEGRNECDRLLDYENLVDRCFPGRPVTGICQYNMNAFPPEALEAIAEAHRLHLTPSQPHSFHSGIRVRMRDCWTEIVADKLVVDPNYYYVVQRRRSTEVLGWGIAPTYDMANEKAEHIVSSHS